MIRLLADGTLILVLLASAAVIGYDTIRKRLWQSLPYAVMAGLTSLLIAKLVSLVYQPSVMRPFLEQGVQAGAAFIDNPGFPSDHALLGTVAVLATYAVTRRRWVSLVLAGIVVVMCVARVVALVHTPLDVMGGVAIGLIGGLWYVSMPKASKKA